MARGMVLITFLQAGEQRAYIDSSIAMGMGLGLKIASVLTLASLAWLLFGTKESH